MTTQIKVAAVQAAPVFLNLEKSIEKAVALIEQAGAQGVRLLGFPEVWLPGYPWWIWLGDPGWGMPFFARYHANALEVESPQMRRLQDAAARAKVNVMLGFAERDGGSLFMSQALIDEAGKLVYARRKLKPTHVERSVFGEGDGSDLRVAELPIGRVGGLNCWEHLQPLSTYAMHAMQEQLHVAAWPSFTLYRGLAYALSHQVALSASQTYAVQGQCCVLFATALTGQDMFDVLCDTPEKRRLLNPETGAGGGGFSMIFGPDGRPLAEPIAEDLEGLVTAEIDLLPAVAVAKAAGDPAGHYARADALHLVIDRRRRRPVVEVGEVNEEDGVIAPQGRRTHTSEKAASLLTESE